VIDEHAASADFAAVPGETMRTVTLSFLLSGATKCVEARAGAVK